MSEQKAKKTKPIICKVISDKMNKSRVGVVERRVRHPGTGKYLVRRTKLMFHDDENKSLNGDKVMIESSRPLSARKRFRLVKVIEQGVRLSVASSKEL